MSLLNRKMQIAVKKEATEGTAETLAAADVTFNVFGDPTFNIDPEVYERNPKRSTIGQQTGLIGAQPASISFTTELVGTGDSSSPFLDTPFDVPLLACGFERHDLSVLTVSTGAGLYLTGETVTGGTSNATATVAIPNYAGSNKVYIRDVTGTFQAEAIVGGTSGTSRSSGGADAEVGFAYAPTSTFNATTNGPSVTLGLYNDGKLYTMRGARGNVTLRAQVGEPVQLDFEFQGAYSATTDTAMLTGTSEPARVPPQLFSALFGLSDNTDFTPVFNSFSLSSGNDVQLRRDANSSTGILSAKIVSRAGSGEWDPEDVLVATEDYEGKLVGNTTFATSCEVGSTAGNSFVLHAPKAQYADLGKGERSGNVVNNITLRLNESLGDDELIIAAI